MKHIVLILLAGTALTGCFYSGPPEMSAGITGTSSSKPLLPESTLQFNEAGNFYGDFYVEGFGQTVQIPEPFCEADCEQYPYVYFAITHVEGEEFDDFLQKNSGDPFGELPGIGLGCLEQNTIAYSNDSDEYGMKEFTLSTQLTSAIMQANALQPVRLYLQKLPLSGGGGAPVCYSHFTNVELL